MFLLFDRCLSAPAPPITTGLNAKLFATVNTPGELRAKDVLPISQVLKLTHFAFVMLIGDENTQPSKTQIAEFPAVSVIWTDWVLPAPPLQRRRHRNRSPRNCAWQNPGDNVRHETTRCLSYVLCPFFNDSDQVFEKAWWAHQGSNLGPAD